MLVNLNKLQNLVLYIANHTAVKDLGLTKLWKLIYFCDATAMRELGSSITGSEFIKYPQGPVPSRGEKALKRLRKDLRVTTESKAHHGHQLTSVVAQELPELEEFSSEELAVIDQVCRQYGNKTAQQLSNLSHKEPSWRLANNRDKLDASLMLYSYQEDPVGL